MVFGLTKFGPISLQLAYLRLRIFVRYRAPWLRPTFTHGVSGFFAFLVLVAAATYPTVDFAQSIEAGAVPSSQASKTISLDANPQALSAVTLPLSIGVDEGVDTRSDRGVFLTRNSMHSEYYLNYTIDRLLETGGNAIIFDVKGSGVHFKSDAPLATELGLANGIYDLRHVLAVLKERKIRSIARYIAIKDDALTRVKPETQLTNPAGSVVSHGWINPTNELALRYNREIICELAAAGVEEINLDYIRYRTEDFNLLSFIEKDDKVSRIVSFVRMAREAIDECGPDTRLGISTFSVLGWDHDANVEGIGQDIIQLAPLVDVISPMAYNANFSLERWGPPADHKGGRWHWLVYRTLMGYRELLGPEQEHKLRPWLQGFGVDTSEIKLQMQGVFDAGVCGFTIWNANNGYEPFYNAFDSMKVPEKCMVQPIQ